MGVQNNEDWGEPFLKGRSGFLVSGFIAFARALEAESQRWFLWLPVFFGGGILAYFAFWSEPDTRLAAALVLAAVGFCLTLRNAPLGFALSLAFLAFALGFANAKLRTEMVRAPVLSQELRFVPLSGWVETYELRDKGGGRGSCFV